MILYIIIALLTAALAASLFFLWKFVKIIMIFEDDLSASLNCLNDVEDSIENVLGMQLFFDSPEVKKETEKLLEQVRVSRMQVQTVIQRFTARSKRQYVTVWEEQAPPAPEEEDTFDPFMSNMVMPGQPPNTPNPMEVIFERRINNAGRQRR